jgi:hypothetical protein
LGLLPIDGVTLANRDATIQPLTAEVQDEFGIGPEYAETMATFRIAKALDSTPASSALDRLPAAVSRAELLSLQICRRRPRVMRR